MTDENAWRAASELDTEQAIEYELERLAKWTEAQEHGLLSKWARSVGPKLLEKLKLVTQFWQTEAGEVALRDDEIERLKGEVEYLKRSCDRVYHLAYDIVAICGICGSVCQKENRDDG